MEKKKRRPRRTNEVIDKDIMLSIKTLIDEIGFDKVTLTGIAQRAKIEPNVFYNRFQDLANAFDSFTEQYDYWFHDVANIKLKGENQHESMDIFFANLIKEVYKNKIVQRILTWELHDNNITTRRTSTLREEGVEKLAKHYTALLGGNEEAHRATAAVVIGGIYYVVLHQHVSTFCGINFANRKGQELLGKVVTEMCNRLFLFPEDKAYSEARHIASKLKQRKVDATIIAESTGVSLSEIEAMK